MASIEDGRLASFTVAVPDHWIAPDRALGGDTLWFGADGLSSIHASKVAACFENNAADRFRTECARWCLPDAEQDLPVALFTAPPATVPGAPFLWVPQVAARRGPKGTVLIFTARKDARPAQAVLAPWLQEARRILWPASTQSAMGNVVDMTSSPVPIEWGRHVRAAIRAIKANELAKVVLSRRIAARLSHPIDPAALARALTRSHPGCHIFSLPSGQGHVVAASPEPLAIKRGTRLVSHALAGTAKRHAGPDGDGRAAQGLLASSKERLEHAIVVESIVARMREICTWVEHPPAPAIKPLRFVQHLWTPVTGELRQGVGLLDAVACLHPTPAVLGMPAAAARDWLERIGERRDGLYSGVAGWIDAAGDGDAVVVLRAAHIEDRKAILWAGAGIMAASDPDAELAETELKLATMLEALNAS